MIRAFLLLLAVAQATACATAGPHPVRDLFGVTVGMPRSDAHAKLGAAGSLAREERKRQEVWTVRDDRFEGAIVGYDPEWRVRFITAVAKKDGTPVRYADVLDVASATHRSTGASHNYRWHPPRARYTIVAIGNDPERLTYLTLTGEGEEEEEEDEDD